MQLLELRNVRGHRTRSEEIATKFTSALFNGDVEAAAKLAAPNFTWFGQTSVNWSGEGIRCFVSERSTTISNLRLLETREVELIPEESRGGVFGSLGASERVLLMDLTRGGKTSTAMLVVDLQAKRVVRISDAMIFKAALERLVRELAASST